MDVKTRKRLMMFGAFHKKRNVHVVRLYIKRKGGGRVLISMHDCVREEG